MPARPQYIDKNYGGMTVIWDRLLGTFMLPGEEKMKFGITKELGTYDPIPRSGCSSSNTCCATCGMPPASRPRSRSCSASRARPMSMRGARQAAADPIMMAAE